MSGGAGVAPPRRVLMTIDAVGGVWRYAMDAAAGLLPFGVDLVFAGFGPAPTAAQAAEASRFGTLRWLDLPLDWMARNERELDHVSDGLQRLAERHRAELLHLNLPGQASGIPPGFGLPIVAVSHSCIASWFAVVRGNEPPPDWRWQVRREAAGLARASLVAAPSRSHAALLARCYASLPLVRVVPNAVTPLRPAPRRAPLVFAAARWWDEGKNARVLDRAARRIVWPVLMAGALGGPGGERTVLRHARGLGVLPSQRVRAHLSRAAVFVSPSRYEPFGLAALEAASAGSALVLADIPTYRELWQDCALFVPPDGELALADAVNRLAADPTLRRSLGARARQRAQRFSRASQARHLLACYAEAA